MGLVEHLVPHLSEQRAIRGNVWWGALLALRKCYAEVSQHLVTPEDFHAASLSLGRKHHEARHWLLTRALEMRDHSAGVARDACQLQVEAFFQHDGRIIDGIGQDTLLTHARFWVHRKLFEDSWLQLAARRLPVGKLEMAERYRESIGVDTYGLSSQALVLFISFLMSRTVVVNTWRNSRPPKTFAKGRLQGGSIAKKRPALWWLRFICGGR